MGLVLGMHERERAAGSTWVGLGGWKGVRRPEANEKRSYHVGGRRAGIVRCWEGGNSTHAAGTQEIGVVTWLAKNGSGFDDDCGVGSVEHGERRENHRSQTFCGESSTSQRELPHHCRYSLHAA